MKHLKRYTPMDWVKIFILLIAINFIVIFTGIMIENSEVTNARV